MPDSTIVSPIDAFRASAERYPARPALEVGGVTLTYSALERRAGSLARALRVEDTKGPLVAFLAYRSIEAYTAVLGILAAGKGYVPLNPNFPATRSATMLTLSGCRTLVLAEEGVSAFEAVCEHLSGGVRVLCFPGVDVGRLRAAHPRHAFLELEEGDHRIDEVVVDAIDRDATAYLLFTSGSTGVPKGVPVSHANVASYLDYVVPRYGFVPEDRFSQTFDMTFDLSVHDMFACWASGACLVAIPHASVMAPAKVIRDLRLTVWFSVPSVVMFMQRLRTLKAGGFPALRVSLFCGEPLLEDWADAWQGAAPNSIVENVYGPTEATIAISHYRWNPERAYNHCVNGIVPIGTIFPTQRGIVVEPDGVAVAPGTPGELWLGGAQVTSGYLGDPERTARQFVRHAANPGTWYRTGDLVVQDERGDLQYLGRVDQQVQIRGHRVELQEVDAAVRRAAGDASAISVAWPPGIGRADAVYAFLCAPPQTDTSAILARCADVLPSYMVPKAIFLVDRLPVNANGKIDRAALTRTLGELLNHA